MRMSADAFMRYRDGAATWELMIVLRRSFAVLFGAMLVYFSTSSNIVLSFGAFIFYFIAQLIHQRIRPYNDHTLNQLDDLSLFSINCTILCGIFFQTQDLNSWSSDVAGLGLAACLFFVGLYLVWFALDEVFANIPATSHLLSSQFWVDLVLPLVFARHQRTAERAMCGCCRRRRQRAEGDDGVNGVDAFMTPGMMTPRSHRASVVYTVAVNNDDTRSFPKKVWSLMSEFPSRAVVRRQEEYSSIAYDHFVSTSKRFFRVTMHVLEFRMNSYVFPFLRRMSTNVADYSMPIIAQVPADATNGLLASAASEAVEFWLKHARTYEFEGMFFHAVRGVFVRW